MSKPQTPVTASIEATATATAQVDLSKLIRLDFGELTMVLSQVLQRLNDLEKQVGNRTISRPVTPSKTHSTGPERSTRESDVDQPLEERPKDDDAKAGGDSKESEENDHEHRLAALEEELESIKGNLGKMNTKQDGLAEKMNGDMADEIDDLKAAQDELKAALEAMKAQINDTAKKEEVDGTKRQADTNTAQLEELTPAVAAIHDDTEDLKNRVAALERAQEDHKPEPGNKQKLTKRNGDSPRDTEDTDSAKEGEGNTNGDKVSPPASARELDDLRNLIATKAPAKEVEGLADHVQKNDKDIESIKKHLGLLEDRPITSPFVAPSKQEPTDISELAKQQDLDDLKKRLDAAEGKITGLGQRTDQNERDIERERGKINDLSQRFDDLLGKIQMLESQLKALFAAPKSPAGESRGGGISEAQLLMLQGTLDGLKERLDALEKAQTRDRIAAAEGIANLSQQIQALKNTIEGILQPEQTRLAIKVDALTNATQRLDQVKADKALLDDLAGRLSTVENRKIPIPPPASPSDGVKVVSSGFRPEELDELRGMISQLSQRLTGLQSDKAERAALERLANDHAMVRRELQQAADKIAAQAAQNANSHKGTAEAAAIQAANEALQSSLQQLGSSVLKDRDWAHQQVLEIRATIEHIHHTKADANLVANKAERDYVENALEKLMREVEQVMNQTNAGLIDTLDKSLGMLRDMIDGKASKTDLNKVKSLVGEEGMGNVPEGLAGFKSYRCLGCNRNVDAMRPRPMGANFASFMNRLPANTSPRAVTTPLAPQSAQKHPLSAEKPAGYITAKPPPSRGSS